VGLVGGRRGDSDLPLGGGDGDEGVQAVVVAAADRGEARLEGALSRDHHRRRLDAVEALGDVPEAERCAAGRDRRQPPLHRAPVRELLHIRGGGE